MPSSKYRVFAIGAALVIAALLAVMAIRGDTSKAAEAVAPSAPARPATIVQFTPAKEMAFSEFIASDGTIKARFSALVSPKVKGTIDDICVREGDEVKRGETKLFQVDNEKLRQSVEHAKQSLVIARSTLDERKANLDKADADLAQAGKDFARAKSLYEQKVVPLSEYEIGETKVAQLKALRRVCETNLTLAEQAVTLSKISLDMAERDLRDSVALSPIDGVVSSRSAEPGEMGSTDKSILKIDDVKQLKALAYLPGQFYPSIRTGSSIAQVSVLGKKIGDFPITYKAPAIDSALRTFEIWADIPGDGAYAVPGAQCVIRVVLKDERGVGVPRDAIQFRDNKTWVFVPDGDVAKMVEVKSGLETNGWTELVDSPLKPGDRVVTQGQFLLENGHPIRERGK